jgi:hypothetical protein
MNTDAFAARWNTGDGTPHSDYIITMFRYANRQPDPHLVQMYVDCLNHIPLDELKAVWPTLQPSLNPRPILPGIEALKEAHSKRKKDYLERKADLQEKRRKVTVGEKDVAKKAVNSAYAHRVMQHLGFEFNITQPEYSGDFDYQSVAESAGLPDIDDHKHEKHWREVWRLFERAWEEYAA